MIADMVRRSSISKDFLTLMPETAFMATAQTSWCSFGIACSIQYMVIHNIMCCCRVCLIKMEIEGCKTSHFANGGNDA